MINLNKLEELIDSALDKETEQSLTRWLLNKRSGNFENHPTINTTDWPEWNEIVNGTFK